jgi:hypothetical protein
MRDGYCVIVMRDGYLLQVVLCPVTALDGPQQVSDVPCSLKLLANGLQLVVCAFTALDGHACRL